MLSYILLCSPRSLTLFKGEVRVSSPLSHRYTFIVKFALASIASSRSGLQGFLSPSHPTMSLSSAPSRPEVLSLFRSLIRTARKFTDYNIREYAKRRTTDGFRQYRDLSDPSSISSAYSEGKSQLEVAKRQAVVYSLYAPKVKSVMEVESH